MTRIAALFLSLILLPLCACAAPQPFEELPQMSGVTMTIPTQRITPKTEDIAFVIQNESAKELFIAMETRLEIQKNGEWEPVGDYVDLAVDAQRVSPHASVLLSCSLRDVAGNPKPGRYRLGVPFLTDVDSSQRKIDDPTSYGVYAEFEIEAK